MTQEFVDRDAVAGAPVISANAPVLTELPMEELQDVHGGTQIFVKTLTGKTITLESEGTGRKSFKRT